MNQKKATPPPLPTLSLEDVYYILFRHKWKILIISSVAVALAAYVRSTAPVSYHSEAALMIKYVHETKLDQIGVGQMPISGDIRGEMAIDSEIEILRSADLASAVVDVLGASNILAKAGGGSNANQAVVLIRTNFSVIPTRSEVIQLQFNHPDAEMVQPILTQLIKAYYIKHDQIHNPGINDQLTKERDDAKARILSVDKDLQKLEADHDIISAADIQKSYSGLIGKLMSEKMDAETDLASDNEKIREMMALYGPLPTNQGPKVGPENRVTADVPLEKTAEYQELFRRLAGLRADGERLRMTWTSNNPLVQTNLALIAQADAKKKALEEKYPALTAVTPPSLTPGGPTTTQAEDPHEIMRKIMVDAGALIARIRSLTNQIASNQKLGVELNEVASQISALEREKNQAVQEAAMCDTQLWQLTVMQAVPNFNISEVEAPQPAARNVSQVNKTFGMILFGGLFLAFGLPFAIELFLDRSLRRPGDVQNRLGLPFFISIPMLKLRSDRKALKEAKAAALLTEPVNGETPNADGVDMPLAPNGNSNGVPTLWEDNPELYPFHETLRDRLMTYFEMINLTHKPKLVAVTACAEGAGVTSTAAGLASSLSETGEGNVLLVNMNARDGEAHHFYKGKLTCNLDDVLEKGMRTDAFVQGNLYMAKEQSEDERLPRVLPKRFNHLLPKMKASDFDYIIFDMPPVSQISITPRLARFMDMVLLVVESGKTNRDVAKHAAQLLSETKTNVGIVLNKTKNYAPRQLRGEL